MLLLGGIKLEVLRLTALSGDDSWEYAEHATIEGLPVQQFLARNASGFTLEVRLHRLLGDPAELERQLRQAADAGEVLPLQTAEGTMLGYYSIRSLGRSWSWTAPDGRLLDGTWSIKVVEHRAPPEPPAPRLAVGVAGDPAAAPVAVDSGRDPSEVSLSEIVRAG